MASYSKLVITGKGQALIAKMIAGTGNIEFTKVSVSNTEYEESQLTELETLSGVQQTSLVSKVTRTNNVAIKIEAAFSNTSLITGYYMRALGLYAKDPDEGEILYAVCVETTGNCYMPPYNGVTVSAAYIQMYTTVGNADSVSLDVDSGAYATIGDIQALEKEIADLQSFVGYKSDDIYGVEVDFVNKKFTRLSGATNMTPGDMFDKINAYGGRKRCNLTDAGVVVAYQGDSGFSTTGALTQAVTVGSTTYAVGTKVQVMVEQPRFYYKVVPLAVEEKDGMQIMRKCRYYMSDTAKAGFKLHPAFINNGVELDKIYLSAFEGSLYDSSAGRYILDDSQVADFSADMMSSIANAKPISSNTQNLTRANTRLLCEKRGIGWEQQLIQTASATQLLMLIEYASFNMQDSIGLGNCNKPWKEDGINYAENTGATVTLGNKSGAVTNTNGIVMVSYRGEENFWANIWKWIDGINQHARRIYIADHSFKDDTGAEPYVDTKLDCAAVEGFISAFSYNENYDWLFIPGECAGSDHLPVSDYFWINIIIWSVARLGASWDYGLSAGAFCLALAYASGGRARHISGRLVYRPAA